MKAILQLVFFTIAIAMFGTIASAQQEVQFTHYMYNTLTVNPAYAGSKGMLNMSALMRQQWIGIDGAPVTQNFIVHSPIVSKNIGVGLSFLNDKAGPIQQTSLAMDYSYSIQVNQTGKLNVGIKGMLNFVQANLSTLKLDQLNDPTFAANPTILAPNVGLGLYYHTDKWYLGASTPKVLETSIAGNSKTIVSKLNRHYYVIGGYVFDVAADWKMKPAFLAKLTSNAPLSLDASFEAYYKNLISLGVMHRFGDSFGFLCGYQITNQFKVGASFDQTVSRLKNYNNGTFEMFLSYDFTFKKDKIITPRYF
jgi:type IX secretion system PorP/SprF family membrane protein